MGKEVVVWVEGKDREVFLRGSVFFFIVAIFLRQGFTAPTGCPKEQRLIPPPDASTSDVGGEPGFVSFSFFTSGRCSHLHPSHRK